MKKVYKYGTGDEIPEGAIYLTTVVQEILLERFVWHYFLVDEDDKRDEAEPFPPPQDAWKYTESR